MHILACPELRAYSKTRMLGPSNSRNDPSWLMAPGLDWSLVEKIPINQSEGTSDLLFILGFIKILCTQPIMQAALWKDCTRGACWNAEPIKWTTMILWTWRAERQAKGSVFGQHCPNGLQRGFRHLEGQRPACSSPIKGIEIQRNSSSKEWRNKRTGKGAQTSVWSFDVHILALESVPVCKDFL